MSQNVTGQGARFFQILRILVKNGAHKGMDPVKFREILEDLGPTYVKIGQIMATRQDMFSQRYCKELEKLRSDARPVPFETVTAVIEEAYGKPWNETFASIEEEPIGCASIAQVHKARLTDGTDVVIKVQRPGIYQEMEADVKLIRKAAGLLKISEVFSSVVDVDTVIDEFWQTARQEMDFSVEAANCIRFEQENKGFAYIGACKAYPGLAARHVMVMDYVAGFEIGQTDELEAAGYDRKEIAARLTQNYLHQVLDDGFFHADPHAGNLRILDGRIVYIDFGMMGTLTDRDKKIMKDAILALSRRDTPALCDAILALGKPVRRPNYTQFSQDIETYVNTYCDTSLQDINLTVMVQQMFNICHIHGIRLPKGISMLARSLVTMEGTLQMLDPETNVMKIVSASKTDLLDKDWSKEFQQMILQIHAGAHSLLTLPVQTSAVLHQIQKGQAKINLELLGSGEPIANLDRMINRIVVCVLIAALLMSSSIICTTDLKPKFLDIPLLGLAGYFIAFCMSLWLFVKMLFLHQKNKPF